MLPHSMCCVRQATFLVVETFKASTEQVLHLQMRKPSRGCISRSAFSKMRVRCTLCKTCLPLWYHPLRSVRHLTAQQPIKDCRDCPLLII